MNDQLALDQLEKRLGRSYATRRLGIERDHESKVFGQGINLFHIENFKTSHVLIRTVLILAGLYRRGLRNAIEVAVRHHEVQSRRLARAFDGFTILQLSDLHADMSEHAMARVASLLPELTYDVCVLTGDYRGKTFGPHAESMASMARLRALLKDPVYGVLGNHDTILMVPELEDTGVKMLVNEFEPIERHGECIYLAGIDDAHFYRMDSIEKASVGIPVDAFSLLISHTPEIYQQAARAGFDLLLSGHTHGGQICLPGRFPITLSSVLPRSMGSGAWKYQEMIGYTSTGAGSSIVPVRFNCPPEITLHRLRSK